MLTPTGLGPRKAGGINAVMFIREALEVAGRQRMDLHTKRTFTSLRMAIKWMSRPRHRLLLRLRRRRGRRNQDNRHQAEVNVRGYSSASPDNLLE